MRPGAASVDHSRERWLWQEALRQLTGVRRVVFPLEHDDFALDDDQVSHGARLWANLLSLMVTNAWLEQNNREVVEVRESKANLAVVATPDDYEVAYKIFTKICKRTVINLSESHRKILNGLHGLHKRTRGATASLSARSPRRPGWASAQYRRTRPSWSRAPNS